MTENERTFRTPRRGLLSTVAGTGFVAVFGSIASRYVTADTSTGAGDEFLLGPLESALDEWRPGDDVALSRVARRDRPIAVTEGEYALEATVDGNTTPTISRRVADLDLMAHPYFVAGVTPGRIAGTDSALEFRFRLVNVLDDWVATDPIAESDPIPIPQAMPARIYWDASDVDTGLLDATARLEITWSVADRDSGSSTEIDTRRGGIVFDAVRATNAVGAIGRARLAATMRDLQFDHGVYVRTTVTAESETREEGEFVFADGETEPYRFERLAADRHLLTVAGTEIEFGGGWH
ncbi:hypothetical protein [Halopiger aswanensis]|uniref:Uncharacterized protein n=1 Tax=Halopiger aswanensis TaxID=148449 RepID=A0A419W0C8_9EURY|nr:hypothetical protein [Halopiger aswanensis]RKD88936.1 hypothetical protein ATJ93_3756 [Halopiger aswanensis]